jgi:serine/threonine-protein kinase HipA
MNPYGKCLVCYQSLADQLYHPQCARKLFGKKVIPTLDLDQDDVNELAGALINQRLAMAGVQRKLSLQLESLPTQAMDRLTLVGYLGGSHILKPPAPEYPHMPEVEHLTMHLAEKCGIRTAPHGLIIMKDGQLAYITKRFDREGKKKIAVEDLCQLSEMMTEQKDKSTAERVGKVIKHFSSNPGDDALRYFEVTVFSFLTGNADMHMKNFSLITDKPDRVTLSPAYDLLSTRLLISEKDDPEELTLSVQGKKSSIKRSNFIFLGKNLMIPEKAILGRLEEFIESQDALMEAIHQSILPELIKQEYQRLVRARFSRIKES